MTSLFSIIVDKLALSIMLALVVFLAGVEAAEVTTLRVKKEQANLHAQQEERSEILAKLTMGDRLTPLANALGNEAWYLVQTPKGVTGWIRSSDIEGTESLQRTVQDSDNPVSSVNIPNESSVIRPSLNKETSVPIVMNGKVIIVPVLLNRSVTSNLMMDTGASFTLLTPALAKRLRLTLGQRVSLTTANGMMMAPLARLGSLKVGDAEVNGLQVTVHNFGSHPFIEGLLGLDFLSRFHIAIDSKKQRLILAPR